MQRILTVAVAAALATGLTAQSSYETVPPGYLTKPGETWRGMLIVGFTAKSSFQHGCRLQVGHLAAKAGTLVTVDWRSATSFTYGTPWGMGRKFSSLALRLGHTDCDKFQSRFSLNYKGPGTTVFSGAVTLPSNTSGRGKGKWGDCGRIAFKTPFTFNGKDHLLEDWSHTGFVLANGATRWGPYRYNCDGCYSAGDEFRLEPGDRWGGKWVPRQPIGGSKRCTDSATTWWWADAGTSARLQFFGDRYQITSLRSKFRATLTTNFTALGKPAIAAISVGGSEAGTPVGAKCNRLHVNMNTAIVVSSKTADRSGTAKHLDSYGTYTNAVAGYTLFAQGAWQDSKGGLGLTTAVKINLITKEQGFGCAVSFGTYRYRYPSGTTFRWSPTANAAEGHRPVKLAWILQRYGRK